MSEPEFPPPANPYATSVLVAELSPQRSADRRPVWCVVAFIVSLIFCAMRLPFVILGIKVLVQIRDVDDQFVPPAMATVPLEVLTGGAVVLCSLVGNIGLLAKKRWAVFVAYATVVASLANVAVACWGLNFAMPQGNDLAMFTVFLVAAAVTLLFRLTIIGLYTWAVAHYSRWLARQ